MLDYLRYLFRTYCWSVLFITLMVSVGSTVAFLLTDEANRTAFSHPVFVTLVSAVVLPISNLPVFLLLFRYRFTKWEVLMECILFIILQIYVEKLVFMIFPSDMLWIRESGEGFTSMGRPWWAQSEIFVVYAIVLTSLIMACYRKLWRK